MSEWKEYRLSDLASIQNRKRVPLNSRQRAEIQGKYPYYGASGIVDHINDYIFDGQYVLISEDGENLRSRQTPIAFLANGRFWVNNHAHILQGNDELINEFIVYYFQFLDITPFITGAAQPKLNLENLLSIPIFSPDRETRIALTQILNSLDRKIENLRQQNETLEQIAQTLFKHWFVDFEFPNEDGKPYKSSGGKMERSELGDIPVGWQALELADISTNHSETHKFEKKSKIIFVNTGDVLEGNFLHQNYSPVSTLPGQAKKRIKQDDILYSEIRPINRRFAYVGFSENLDDYVVSTKFMVVRSNGKILPRLLYLILKRDSTVQEFQATAESRSGTFPQITFESVAKFPVVIPEIIIQQKLMNSITPLLEKREFNIRKIQTLTQTRDRLLPKLMSGQLRIAE
jgi:type I restriction enzyme, S subunit